MESVNTKPKRTTLVTVLTFTLLTLATLPAVAQHQHFSLGNLSDGNGTTAIQTNDAGHVMGYDASLGFRHKDNAMSNVGVGAYSLTLTDLSDDGLVIGHFMSGESVLRIHSFTYPYIRPPYPPNGNDHMRFLAVNDVGQIAASTGDMLYTYPWPQDMEAMIVEADGSYTLLGMIFSPRDINNLGQVVGATDDEHARFWTGAGQTVLEDLFVLLPGAETWSSADFILESGEIFGTARTDAGNGSSLVSWDEDGTIHDLGNLGGDTPRLRLEDANQQGELVGSAPTASGETHAFYWSESTGLVDLGTLGGDYSAAFGISENGIVAGTSRVASGEDRAFYWKADTGMVDLGVGTAADVNSCGEVVGKSGYFAARWKDPGLPCYALTAANPSSNDELGSALVIDGDTLAVGEHRNDDEGAAAGAVHLYGRDHGGAGNWGVVQQIYASDADSGDKFGVSVALSGDTLAVGSYLDDDGGRDSGSVYVYERDAGGTDNWGEVKKVVALVPKKSDRFGISVALHGDVLVVGADKYDGGKTDAGAAYVFERDAGGTDNWGQVKLLTASDRGSYDKLGVAVAVNGSTVAVGANKDNNEWGSDAGSVYLFKRDTGGTDNWGQAKKLMTYYAEEEDEGDDRSEERFGTSLAMSGSYLVVGADAEGEDAGRAYIFSTGGGRVAQLVGSDSATYDRFGASVAVFGTTVLVGAPDHAGRGAVYIFAREESFWFENGKLGAADADDGDELGTAVAINDVVQVVGAPFADSGGTDTGSAYVYRYTPHVWDD